MLFVKILLSMYRNVQSRVRVNDNFKDDFLVQVGLHYGSSGESFVMYHNTGDTI